MILQAQKHGPFAKQDVLIAMQNPNSHEDVLGAPLKHGLYHVYLLPSIHVLNRSLKHELYHVLVSHPIFYFYVLNMIFSLWKTILLQMLLFDLQNIVCRVRNLAFFNQNMVLNI